MSSCYLGVKYHWLGFTCKYSDLVNVKPSTFHSKFQEHFDTIFWPCTCFIEGQIIAGVALVFGVATCIHWWNVIRRSPSLVPIQSPFSSESTASPRIVDSLCVFSKLQRRLAWTQPCILPRMLAVSFFSIKIYWQ